MYVDSHDYGPDSSQTTRYNSGTQAWAENLNLIFTFRGIPCLYYGGEVEFQKGQVIDVGRTHRFPLRDAPTSAIIWRATFLRPTSANTQQAAR